MNIFSDSENKEIYDDALQQFNVNLLNQRYNESNDEIGNDDNFSHTYDHHSVSGDTYDVKQQEANT